MSFWSVVVDGSPVDFDTLGLHVTREFSGVGMPPIAHNLHSYALQPGALYQSSKVQARVLSLTVDLEGSSYANMHALRLALISIFAPTTPSLTPEVTIYYSGATRPVYAKFRYVSGLDWIGYEGFGQKIPLQLIAVDPMWYEDTLEEFLTGEVDSIEYAEYWLVKNSGSWAPPLRHGFNDTVYAIAVDQTRRRIYYGGAFTTFFLVATNHIICGKDNGNDGWAELAGGVSGEVRSIAIADNGDVWVGHADGASRYNLATDDWTHFTGGDVRSIVIYGSTVYIGGNFTSWQSVSGADYIAQYDSYGGTWSAVGTSPFGSTTYPQYSQSLAIDTNGDLYAGTSGGTGVHTLYRYADGDWVAMAVTDSGTNNISALYIGPDGKIYVAGTFTTLGGVAASNIAVFNGSSCAPLGTGLLTSSGCLGWYNNRLYAGGQVVAGEDYFASWNGTNWYPVDVDLPGTGVVFAMGVYTDPSLGDFFYIGFNTTGTAVASLGSSITPDSTAPVFPVLTLSFAPGSTDPSAQIASITNETTGHVLYFDLTISNGEIITIDLSPGQKTIISSTRGAIPETILEGSALSNFCILGGVENIVTAIITDSTEVLIALAWQVTHWSVDGGSS